MSSSAPDGVPATPRPSASLIIINERNEILLVRRNPKATAFLLSSAPAPLPLEEEAVLEEARNEIHQQKLLFQNFLQSKNLEANVGSLLPFTQWITPVEQPR